MASNIEYQAFTLLYGTLQTGIQSGIDDVVGKAFSKGLVPPHVKSIAGNSRGPQSEGNRTSILLDAIQERIQNLPSTYEDFASVLHEITAFQYLVDMMKDKKNEISKNEMKRLQEQREIEERLRQKRRDFHLSLEDEKQGPSDQHETDIFHPESTPISVSAQRSGDAHFPLFRSFQYGNLGHKSPIGFRGRFSVSSTPALSPYQLSLLSLKSLEPLTIYESQKPITQGMSPVNSPPKGEQLREPNPNESVDSKDGTNSGSSVDHKLNSNQLPDGPLQGATQSSVVPEDPPAINPKIGGGCSTMEMDFPRDSNELHQASSSLTATDPNMSTDSDSSQRRDEDNPERVVPSVQTLAPTPMTSLPSSSACSPTSDTDNHQLNTAVLQPPRISAISQLSIESTTSSQDYETPPTSLVVDNEVEFSSIQESEEAQQYSQGVDLCHLQRRQIVRSSSREQYTELKAKFEQVTKDLSQLQIQCYVQQSAHRKKEEDLLKKIESEKKEKFELQVNLEKYVSWYLDLQLSLGQHQKYILTLESELGILKKKLEEVKEELKDVKVDAYDKGRELECLKSKIKKYESQLECVKRLPF